MAKAQCVIREYHTIYLIIFGVLKGQFHKNCISLRLLWHTIHRYWAGCETELAVCKYQKKWFFRIHVRYWRFSAEKKTTRNPKHEHFLPWNNGNCSESNLQIFLERNYVANPTYQPARLHRLAESIPWNRFLGSWKSFEVPPRRVWGRGLIDKGR